MKSILSSFFVVFAFVIAANGQVPVVRESQKQEISQILGDTKISVVYHRPNVKGRKNIFGCSTTQLIQKGANTGPCLVPYGQVWRTGANDNTTIEFSNDVKINGQPIRAGKYAFFAIPGEKEWTLIFSRNSNAWGAGDYKIEEDEMRVVTIPEKSEISRESMMYEFESSVGGTSKVVLSWEKVKVPFTIDVGDYLGRVLAKHRDAVAASKPDDAQALNQAAGFVLSNKIAASYSEALAWFDKSIALKETFGNLSAKARLLKEMGKTADAVAAGEKAIAVGKASTPPVNNEGFESLVAGWKAKK